MGMSDVLVEQGTLIIFCFEPGMTTVDTFKQVKQVKRYKIVSKTSIRYFRDFVMKCLQLSMWVVPHLRILAMFQKLN